MTAISIQAPFPTIPDIDGQPLEDGYIWIGVANLAPITNPITVYWDAALTLPAAQPVRTLGGYPMNSGTPGRLYAATDYSILVQNKTGSTVYSSADNNGPLFGGTISSVDVTFLQAGAGAVERTAQAKMRDVVSVKDFGAVGNGVADDTVAIQAAVNNGFSVYFPRGTYIVQNISVGGNTRLYSDEKAIVKLKAEANFVFDPIFNVTAGGVSFENLIFDGNRANQPANGFSDSWNTGPNNTGKSNRAGIYMDGIFSGLNVVGCEFTGFYAASIATRRVSNVTIDRCYFHDSNLEGCFLYSTAVPPNPQVNVKITNSTFKNLASGDPTVNANCAIISQYDGVIVYGNNADAFERNFVKLELCNRAVIDGNKISNNTIVGFNCLQAQNGGDDISFTNNVMHNVQKGIYVAAGSFTNINVANNTIDGVIATPGGGVTPDGIALENVRGVNISGNTVKNANRFGVYLVDCSDLLVSDNVVLRTIAGGSSALNITTSGAVNTGSASVSCNVFKGMQDGAAGVFSLNGNGIIENLSIVGNVIEGANEATQRGIYTTTSAITFAFASVADNVLADDCILEIIGTASSQITVRNNISPRITAPTGVLNRTLPNRSSIPTTGAHFVGDTVLHSQPVAGGPVGWVCVANGTPGTWHPFGFSVFSNSVSYDPPSLNDGDGVTTTITVTGAAFDDFVSVAFGADLQGVLMTAWVSAPNTVSIRFQNETGGVVDLGSATLRARIQKVS